MPLTMSKAGDTVTIQKITGKDEVRQHLAELGFVVGETVTVVNEISGNLIIPHCAGQDAGHAYYCRLIKRESQPQAV